jgi:digeranylgeranylglycerophospholipid reductase
MSLAKNHRVVVIEEHERAGMPLQCAGLVSSRTVDGVTKRSALLDVEDFVLHTPAGNRLELHAKEPKGVVIDRRIYDAALADKAADLGAEFLYNTRAAGVREGEGSVLASCKSERRTKEIESSLLVGADGPMSVVRSSVTKKSFDILYRGAQFEGADASGRDRTVEMWIGNKTAPGFFAWKIPAGDTVRIGLCTKSDDSPMSLLKNFAKKYFPDLKIADKQAGLIPVGPIGKLSNGRLALMGDAGGQTKPITGGGVFLGKRAAEILAESIDDAGVRSDALSLYERLYRNEFESQISRAWLVRKIINRLSDKKLEKAVEILSDNTIRRILERSGDIDDPTGLASALIPKAPRLLQFAPAVLRSLR